MIKKLISTIKREYYILKEKRKIREFMKSVINDEKQHDNMIKTIIDRIDECKHYDGTFCEIKSVCPFNRLTRCDCNMFEK